MDFFKLLSSYLDFMHAQGYADRDRETLLSPIFPTTFAMSGGPDLAYKFWRGDEDMRGNFVINQPCIRHWDIDNVGDNKHLSFFNMFVTDSIEGFSRRTVMEHNFVFLTKNLGLDPKRLFVTYFGGGVVHGKEFPADNEAAEIWLSFGISPDHLIPMRDGNVMEAFVANTVEPVGGPRTEMFYDLRTTRSRIDSPEMFMKFADEGTILELFTQVTYNVVVKWEGIKGTKPICRFTEMDREAFAAGFGPQRLLRILEGVSDIGSISEFRRLCTSFDEQWTEEGGRKPFYKNCVIAADHVRGLVFLIYDGILDVHGKKNRSRRHLFRKYLINFKRNLEAIPLVDRDATLKSITNISIDHFARVFPDVGARREFLVENIARLYKEIPLETVSEQSLQDAAP